jgi:hypothetical protein
MGIKRMGNWHGDGRYLVEFLTSIEFVNLSTDRPRWYGWGLDIALADGTRKYFYVRWLNYDEAGASQPRKFQIKLADGSYADVPNGSFTWQANENKALPVYMAMVVNTTTGLFEGFRVNAAIREGSLAATSSSSMTALGVVYNETLTAFSGGLNPFFDLVNRSNAAQTRGAISIHEHRTTYLGA